MSNRAWPRLVALLATLATPPATSTELPSDARWLTDANGCKFLDMRPDANDQPEMTWSGGCVDGYVDGQGELVIAARSWRIVGQFSKGLIVTGKFEYGQESFEGTFDDSHWPKEGTFTLGDGSTIKGVLPRGEALSKVEKTWRNGSRYVGDISSKTGLLEGSGTLEYSPGSVYQGQFKNDLPEGRGVRTYSNGSVYDGEFTAGQHHGHGTLTFLTGDVYEGEFADGKYQGKGELRYANGAVYTGEFLSGDPHGRGKQTLATGDVYEGEFVNGKYQGKGELRYANGSSYRGDFVSGSPHGHGTFSDANGGTYEGEFKSGKRHGIGRYADADSFKEGEWVADELNGKCKAERNGKYKYDGQCAAGLRSGQGHFEDLVSSVIYDGSFRNGLREGFGKEVDAQGAEYEGEYARDTWHGRGVMRAKTPDGLALQYDGMFVDGLMEGQGSLTMGSMRLEGDFKGNTLHRGRIVTDSGRSFEIDLEKGTVLELLPDGTKRPASEADRQDLRI